MGDMERVLITLRVRTEDVEMGQRAGKTWGKVFVSVLGITIGTVLPRAALILLVRQTDQVPSVKFIQQLSSGILTKGFFF